MMRKQLRKKKTTRPRPGRKAKKSTADVVADMAASGLVEDEIAQRLGVHKNVLRARHIDSIKAGKAAAVASDADAAALTIAEYHVLDAITAAFSSHWHDEASGQNLIFAGTDGKGARTVADAFAAWKAKGGRWNCTGLTSRFNKAKATQFAKIVAEHRNKYQTEEN
jgi:hypothetical protein